MRFLQTLLDMLLGAIKMMIALGAILFVAFVVAFFMMIFLPTQTQSAFQFFLELLFK